MTVDSSVTAAVCVWGPGDLPRNRLTAESFYLLLVLTGTDIFFLDLYRLYDYLQV